MRPTTRDDQGQKDTADGRDSPGIGGNLHLPNLGLPKGGGAIRGIGEKFGADPVSGTGSMSVPIASSPGRAGLGPQLSLNYDSGAGNGPFGLGWQLSIPSITRKTDKGLPRYDDGAESDVFVLSGAEDLVPLLEKGPAGWKRPDPLRRTMNGTEYSVHRYRPRIEGLFARIERWTEHTNSAHTFWRSISRDNVTTWYGKTEESRVADPDDAARIFQWLICETCDDKGNVVAYGYKKENSDSVDVTRAHERNRSDKTRSANRYLKRVRYGNRSPYFPDPARALAVPLPSDWCFELVFDYGDHDTAVPLPDEPAKKWPCRLDPFSSRRASFDVRTYRVCRRVLMFHHFVGQPAVGRNCLVRSTDLTYLHDGKPADSRNPIYSFLTAVTHTGYTRQGAGYLSRSMPPLELEYTEPLIDPTVREVDDADSLQNLPEGLDGNRYRFVDVDGDGLSGILTEQAGAWSYKPNVSPSTLTSDGGKPRPMARFGPAQLVSLVPSVAALSSGRQQLLDLTGDGQLDLVDFQSPAPGFFERTENASWEPFKPFDSLPILEWSDPRLRFIDLTGDGHADLLMTEDQVFCWQPSLGEAGFGPAERVLQAFDEELGPVVAFADGTESIFLADLSGDGLTDLVRVRNSEVSYWPNLGHGRFGAKVTMDNPPCFDSPDLFDGKRVRLADLDGSGTTDIVYFGGDGVQIYFNQSGNSWSGGHTLNRFPRPDHTSSAAVFDLLGNGTACLVWSSPLPGNALRPMRYVDLMGGTKPHLLIRVSDNLGAETRIHYAPSTKFSVADRLAGRPWITKVPFPVHVVERVETYDYISRNHFVTRYAYHHGFYDGVEREFRGFGLVEQWDTERLATLGTTTDFPPATNVDSFSHVPPVHTRTWFHTGIYLGRDRVSRFFAGLTDAKDAGQYYREPGSSDEQAARRLLDDTVLDAAWTVDEEREACRALKGSMLRQEVYGLDGSGRQDQPYTVTEQNFTVVRTQPIGGNRSGVFFATGREVLKYSYDRNPVDPRVSHALTLEVDAFGNVRRSLAIGYGRRGGNSPLTGADLAKQTTALVTYTENDVTNEIDEPDAHRTPLSSAVRTYELTGLSISDDTTRPNFDTWTAGNFALLQSAIEIPYEQTASAGKEKRLIEQVRTRYRSDDLKLLLVQNALQSLALPGESYKLAFTPGLLTQVYRRTAPGQPPEDLLPDRLAVMFATGGDRGGYVDLDADGHAWIPSGRVFFWSGANAANPAITAAQETTEARAHFYQAHKWVDPFGQSATAVYDGDQLFVIRTADAIGNTLSAQHDYRVLQPSRVTDPNGNAAEAAFDTLGLLAATALRGKAGQDPGDTVAGVAADLTTAEVIGFFNAANPHTISAGLLASASSRIVYDVDRFRRTRLANPTDSSKWEPVCAASMARETHVNDPLPPAGLKIQISFGYSDGFGREVQKKIQAEDGPVVLGGPVLSPRWVGSGWTIFNNKGQPVRQYEPFFSATHGFEFAKQEGVSGVVFYDPVGRPIVTLSPNDTFDKVLFDPWVQTTWDVNDTAALDPRTDPDVSGFLRQYFVMHPAFSTWSAQRLGGALGPFEKEAADKAAVHAGTPLVAHFDTLGRPFLTIAHNRFVRGGVLSDEKHSSRVGLDIEGNQRVVRDAITTGDPLGRVVMRYDYDMLGSRVHQVSMDAGERWMLNDVAGKPLYAWDSRDHRFRSTYDALRRPTDFFLREGGAPELLIGRTVYGETHPNVAAANLRGKVVQVFDQAGVVTSDAYDFKGNPLRVQRQLAHEYSTTLVWSGPVPRDAPVYTGRTRYDALNRPIQLIAPHSDQPPAAVNIIQPVYNEANLLEQVHVWLDQSSEPAGLLSAGTADLHAVANIDYDARGRRALARFGNGVATTYTHDPLTFRLMSLRTRRAADVLQDLHYTYDPAGNITHIRDDAQPAVFFNNARVEASADYIYDSLYRLIEATGREHLGQAGAAPSPGSYNDAPRVGISFSASDGGAMGRYLERYAYDAVGNFATMQHAGTDPANPGWTREYTYAEPRASNRLTSTFTDPTQPETYSVAGNGYDAHGNMLRMPHLQEMRWDFKDELRMTRRQKVNASDLGGAEHEGERTWYVYDAGGQRVRKVTERSPGVVKEERIYLGGFEIHHRHGANPITRETLHVMDDKQRVALVEMRTAGNEPGVPSRLVRFQLGNHLGSASLELDDQARIISYEEYTPYGSTSYQGVRSQTETPKRYRYTGQERDDESGFNYHGARYYATWLGRWVSSDPAGLVDGLNLYLYARDNPARLRDTNGFETPVPPESPGNRVIALGRRTIDVPGWGELPHTEQYVRNAAENTGLRPVTFGALNRKGSLARDWIAVAGDELPAGSKGLQSGQLIQATLEGATPHHMTTTGIISVLDDTHTCAECRGLIAHLSAERNTEADIFFQEGADVSRIPRGTSIVEGAPLPERIARFLPPSFRQPPPEPGVPPLTLPEPAPPAPSPAAAAEVATVPATAAKPGIPTPPKPGAPILKGAAGAAGALLFVASVGAEGDNEVSSAASVLKAGAAAGVLYLAKRAIVTTPGMVAAAGAVGALGGAIAEEQLKVSHYSAAIGGKIDPGGGVLGGVATVLASHTALTMAVVDKVAGDRFAHMLGIW